jgi:hypothetical protein
VAVAATCDLNLYRTLHHLSRTLSSKDLNSGLQPQLSFRKCKVDKSVSNFSTSTVNSPFNIISSFFPSVDYNFELGWHSISEPSCSQHSSPHSEPNLSYRYSLFPGSLHTILSLYSETNKFDYFTLLDNVPADGENTNTN